jgi:hypothetical protein
MSPLSTSERLIVAYWVVAKRHSRTLPETTSRQARNCRSITPSE